MHARPFYDSDVAPVATLMADPTRATMLSALLAGRPLSAGELARIAGVSAATASAHLARLLDGGLIAVTRQGRHRYYRLAGHEVAAALETMAQISPTTPVRTLHQSREAAALDEARTCYDHLAGRAGVALLDALLARGVLVERPAQAQTAGHAEHRSRSEDEDMFRTDGGDGPHATRFDATGEGAVTLRAFGIDVAELRSSRRRFAGACLDWTQRRRHLNGALGAAVTTRLFELGWIERGQRRRSVRVTEAGRDGLAETFGWSPVTAGSAESTGAAGSGRAPGSGAAPAARADWAAWRS